MSETDTRVLIEKLAPLDGTDPRPFAEGGPVGNCGECGECRVCQARRMAGDANDDRNTETKGITVTENDTRQLIEKLAKHPDGPITSESLARDLAGRAFAAQCRIFGHPYFRANPDPVERDAEFEDFMRRLDLLSSSWMASYMIRALRQADPALAEEVAAKMAEMLEDGQASANATDCWLDEDGIDAERIVQAVQAERAVSAVSDARIFSIPPGDWVIIPNAGIALFHASGTSFSATAAGRDVVLDCDGPVRVRLTDGSPRWWDDRTLRAREVTR